MKPWQKNIRKVEPYIPGEQPDFNDMIKLNTNENPYPPAPGVEEVLVHMDADRLRLYPQTDSRTLVESLADFYHVNEDQIFVGVGSDDVLAMAFLTFFNSDKPILFPDITYSFYDVWANLYRIPFERPAVDEEFRIKKEDYYKENGGIVIANPNAPTSICEDLSFIEDILVHNQDVVVIVDEAYIDFGGTSALSLIDNYENLLVVQTFSKSRSMAGSRIGYCFGNKELIQALNTVKNSYNSYTMNALSIEAGAAAVADRTYFETMVEKVINTREWVKKELKELGFEFPDSKTNFLFLTHGEYDMVELFRYLREKKIFVRHFNAERIRKYMRVSIGTDQEMQAFLEAVRAFIKEKEVVTTSL